MADKKITEFAELISPTVNDVTLTVSDGVTYKIKTSTLLALLKAASVAEINTGTEAGKYVTPDGLAGSTPGTRRVAKQIPGAVSVKDDFMIIDIPSEIWDSDLPYDLVDCEAMVTTAGTTNSTTIQLNNGTNDMLTTLMTIETGEITSKDAATAPVIDEDYQGMSNIKQVHVDVDAVSTTAPIDLTIILYFRRP